MSGGEARKELRPHVRVGEQRVDDAVVVVRGGPDGAAKLVAHARRTHRALSLDGDEFFGVSVFAALDDIGTASLEGILSVRMATYPVVHLPHANALTVAGFELLPTFGRPHFTIAMSSDVDLEVRRLLAALGPAVPNPYHGGASRGRR